MAVAVVLAACEAPPEPPAQPPPATETNAPPALPPVQGFAHEAGLDRVGYYLPLTEVRTGDLRLSHLSIGDAASFEAWEGDGGRGERNFPPIMLQFDDLASERTPNELGGQDPSIVIRVLPSGYGISRSQVRFAGTEPRLGLVTFEGRFVEEGAPTLLVLRGTLTVDGQIFEGQGFAWTNGS